MKGIRILGIITALVLYGFSLYLPAFECRGPTSLSGLGVLTIGYMGFLMLDFRWLGNITFVAMILYLLSDRGARKLLDSPRLLLLPFVTGLLCLWAFVAPAHGCWGGESPQTSDDLSLGGQLWIASLCIASALFLVASIWDTSARASDG